ncbi:MAG: prolipoprotein diacylglyceryl transferase [Candidatus Delongbacteria bacterium]|nr:prolipoprotein diacylglyceryl transferase [Candidatus Cloacimonadota bacterium]MCB9473095.1 prolipoprotein diacylglyceryl transferase [Candidatus Delongbacteria bacterium]
MLATLHWNLSPELFRLGPLAVRWYGLLFMGAFMLGFWLMNRVYLREQRKQEDLDRLLIVTMAGTVIGARLGHCLFYDPAWYLANPLQILKVWQGGLASHGAAVGIVLSTWIFSRSRPDQTLLWLLDRLVVVIALAGMLIRMGNFFNSEIVGIPTTVPWAVVFERVDALPRHPVQLYESICYGLIFVLLYGLLERHWKRMVPGQLLGLFLVLVFGVRFVLEFFKTSQTDFSMPGPLSMGQWLSIPAVAIGLWLIQRARRAAGVIQPNS